MLKPSSRIPSNLEVNLLTQENERLKREGKALCDLTESNPTVVNLDYPHESLAELLGRSRVFPYEPQVKGLNLARQVIAESLAPNHDPERIWVTSSSSESYAYLFKLLCDSGDEVLVPTPSYPLFEGLLGLEVVTCRNFKLDYQEGWTINWESVLAGVGPRTKAILMVHPNNPTGSFLSAQDQEALFALCEERSLALIVDEVFLSFPLQGNSPASLISSSAASFPLFVLGGVSKQFGLPQWKLSWILARANPSLLDGLDWIADHYLSVSTPLQAALPGLWKIGPSLTELILKRVRENYGTLMQRLPSGSDLRVLNCQAGWSAMVELPSNWDEEAFVLRCLRDYEVVLFPGYYFDLPFSASVVVSLLPDPLEFQRGLGQMMKALE